MKTFWFCIVSVLFAAALPAAADVTMEMKMNSSPQKMVASAHNIRIEGPDVVTIFRGDRKLLWTADMIQKTYTEMTEADMAAMGQQINSAMAELQEKLKEMPPDQRAAVEAMMAKNPAVTQDAPPRAVVKATGKSKTINGWPCKEYAQTVGSTVMEVWSTDQKNFSLTPADLGAFKEFAEFMKKMLPGLGPVEGFMKDFDKPVEGQVPGIPVLTVARNDKGEETYRTELVKVAKGPVPPSAFQLPEGLKKEAMPKGKTPARSN